jgi:4-azaleucine resistance transporter AzlC
MGRVDVTVQQQADTTAAAGDRTPARRQALQQGAAQAWPICLGYLPIGLAFGVLAQKAGLAPLEIGLMSILVFAGSAQFIAVSMLNSGAAAGAIVLTTFLVNLRHLLMSSSLSVHLKGSGWRFLALFSYGITDESFAVNLAKFRGGHWHRSQALVVNQLSNAAWVGSTVLGGYTGQFIPAGALGSDYALMAMFLCLLAFQWRGPLYVFTAAMAGGLAVLLSLLAPHHVNSAIAAVVAASAGYLVKRRARRGAPA